MQTIYEELHRKQKGHFCQLLSIVLSVAEPSPTGERLTFPWRENSTTHVKPCGFFQGSLEDWFLFYLTLIADIPRQRLDGKKKPQVVVAPETVQYQRQTLGGTLEEK